MAYGEIYRYYASVYTDVITQTKAALVACGWTQVGVTDFYKSAVPNEDGKYCYAEISDSGANIRADHGVFMNDAETALRDSVGQITSNFIAGHWITIVYPLWWVSYLLENTQYDDYLIGGGLYKPFPLAPFRDYPYWTVRTGSAGGETSSFTTQNGLQEGHLTRMPNFDQRFACPGTSFYLTGVALVHPYRNFYLSGGLVITPSIVCNPVDAFGMMGYQRNALLVYHNNPDRNANSPMIATGSILVVNGVRYFCPPRHEMFGGDQGTSILLQMESIVI